MKRIWKGIGWVLLVGSLGACVDTGSRHGKKTTGTPTGEALNGSAPGGTSVLGTGATGPGTNNNNNNNNNNNGGN